MKTNTTFKTFDVVKLTANATTITTHPNAKDFFGIVREVGSNFSLIEWYNKKNSSATAEATVGTSAWIANEELETVGSLYHLISKGLAPVVSATPAATMAAETAKPKRKYTRKEGSAKPGPKPKKEKVAKVNVEKPKKMTKAEKAAAEAAAETAKGPEIVEFPINGYGRKPDVFGFQRCNYGIATGRFTFFPTREDIERSVRQSGCTYHSRLDGALDFVIVGEKPGPSKMRTLDNYHKSVLRITEKQWLALLGSSKYKFSDEDEARVRRAS